MKTLWSALRREDGAAPVMVFAFAMVVMVIATGLSTLAISNSAVTFSQRITQATEAAVRGTVDSIVAVVNQGGRPTRDALADIEGFAFPIDSDGPARGEVRVETAAFDGTRVHLGMVLTSTGPVKWTRHATATLELADAVSLARIDDGRAVWDFTSPTGANSVADQVVALWTPGELEVFVPGDRSTGPSAPNPAVLAVTAAHGYPGAWDAAEVEFEVAYAGGCLPDESPEIRWLAHHNGTLLFDDTSVRQDAAWSWEMESGDRLEMEARTRCVGGDRTSNWAISTDSFVLADQSPYREVPAPSLERHGETVTVRATSVPSVPPGARVTVDLVVDGAGPQIHQRAEELTLSVPAGSTLTARQIVRIVHADGTDTGPMWGATSTVSGP